MLLFNLLALGTTNFRIEASQILLIYNYNYNYNNKTVVNMVYNIDAHKSITLHDT